MKNNRSFFSIAASIFAGAALVVMSANLAHAQSPYVPAVTPKAAPAPTPDPRVEELQRQLEELKKKSATPAPVPTPTPTPTTIIKSNPMYIVAGIALLIFALLFAFRARIKAAIAARRERNANEAEEHHGPDDHGTAHGIIVGLLALGFAAHSLQAANGCVVTKIGNRPSGVKELTLIIGIPAHVHCATDASAVKVYNGTSEVRVQGLVKSTTSVGWDFSVTPSAPAEYVVKNGNVIIGFLFVTDAPGAFTQHIAVETTRGEIEVVRNGVGTLADRFATLLGNDGKGGTLGTQVQQHEARIAALESKSAPTIDMSAYDKRIASLEQELDAVRGIAVGAQATATKADSKSDMNNDRLNSYGSVVVGTLRRGTIDSKARK